MEGRAISRYGRTVYGGPPAQPLGDSLYGYDYPPQYLVAPFTAQSKDYSSVLLSWNQPQGDVLAFRLLKNRWGFPADQDDGNILIDTANYPGSTFVDTDVVPGQYSYYAIWLLIDVDGDVWVLAGIAACLAVKYYASDQLLFEHTPIYFRDVPRTELTTDTQGNFYLEQFYRILGWGIDYLKTQYDTYLNVNNPWAIPVSALSLLAQQMGMDVVPGISAYLLRKQIYNNAVVQKQRGTPQGVAEEIASATGWDIDLQIGNNLMLENDQSYFPDPSYPAWSANISYRPGEFVSYGNYLYVSNTSNYNSPPTGANSNNTNWNVDYDIDDTTATLTNTVTGWPNTWEPLYPAATNGYASAGALKEGIGVLNPLVPGFFGSNDLRVYNKGGSAQDVWVRSASRKISLTHIPANFAVDASQIIADGIPVPFLLPTSEWNAATVYHSGDIVEYGSQPFKALRRSQGVTPPTTNTPTNEWEPISFDNRIRLMVSGYFASISTANTYAVTPFVEWYDQWGNYITRVFARTPTAGTAARPDQLMFDSFTVLGTEDLSAHTADTQTQTWTIRAGDFTVTDFSGGSIYPAVEGQRSVATSTTGQANCQIGVTFVTAPELGQSQGIIFRRQDTSNYFRADWTTLKLKLAGTWSTLGTYSTPFAAGDRMVVGLNGSTIIVYRNGASVLSVTSTSLQTQTNHGIIVEAT